MYLMQNFFQTPDCGLNLITSLLFSDHEEACEEMRKQAKDALTKYRNENRSGEKFELEDDGDQVHVKGICFRDSWIVSEIGDEPTRRQSKDLIPEGCKYIFAGAKKTLVGNGVDVYFPATMKPNDCFEDKFYRYTYDENDGLSVKVLRKDRAVYGPLLKSICGKPLKSMYMAFHGCKEMRVAPEIPESVTNMSCAFCYCEQLATTPNVPAGVTQMSFAFCGCDSLTVAPLIPDGVDNINSIFDHTPIKSYVGSTDPDGDFLGYKIPDAVTNMIATFSGCEFLVKAPMIPANVKEMAWAFNECKSLVLAPLLPDGVVEMRGVFDSCVSLKSYVGSTDPDGDFSGYKIPDGVMDLSFAFGHCKLMEKAPWIPDSVTEMRSTFVRCTSLAKAPTIPANVVNMGELQYEDGTFCGCTNLTGTLICHANPTKYKWALRDTKITAIEGSCTEETKTALLATK